MMKMYTMIVACLVALLAQAPAWAQEAEHDSVESGEGTPRPLTDIRISVLTCSPGQEVYSLYGHTAIRAAAPARGFDAVFNYGVFSFSQPHFIGRFLLGECDYMSEAVVFDAFYRAYEARGSRVTEQVLSLSQGEANNILRVLLTNIEPENSAYRYNYLYNNCTTRVRDVIEQEVQGTITYPSRTPAQTTREVLHHYTQEHPWASEGNDFLLGAEMDTLASDRLLMFAPEYMMHYLAQAQVHAKDGSVRPLVAETRVLTPGREVPVEREFPMSPGQAGWGVLALCLLVVLAEFLTRHVCKWWSALLLLAHGVAGSLVLFMFLFSAHPGVGSNWLVWPYNSFALLGVGFVLWGRGRAQARWWTAYFCILASFLLFCPLIPQDFGNIVVPLTMCLLTRPISFYLCNRKSRK